MGVYWPKVGWNEIKDLQLWFPQRKTNIKNCGGITALGLKIPCVSCFCVPFKTTSSTALLTCTDPSANYLAATKHVEKNCYCYSQVKESAAEVLSSREENRLNCVLHLIYRHCTVTIIFNPVKRMWTWSLWTAVQWRRWPPGKVWGEDFPG